MIQWVSVETKLPEQNTPVLLWIVTKYPLDEQKAVTGKLRDNGSGPMWWTSEAKLYWMEHSPVTHWAYIQKP